MICGLSSSWKPFFPSSVILQHWPQCFLGSCGYKLLHAANLPMNTAPPSPRHIHVQRKSVLCSWPLIAPAASGFMVALIAFDLSGCLHAGLIGVSLTLSFSGSRVHSTHPVVFCWAFSFSRLSTAFAFPHSVSCMIKGISRKESSSCGAQCELSAAAGDGLSPSHGFVSMWRLCSLWQQISKHTAKEQWDKESPFV